jgi:hypothetical protein
MNPTQLPVACELFAQWQRARGSRMEAAVHPFSRGWEDLLDDAGLASAVDRNDAERDARSLATEGWLEIKSVRYKSHLIDRVVIPLAAETRWREIRLIREFNWEPALAFLRDARINVPFAELCQLNDFLKAGTNGQDIVPVKERSLQIFGDEKRLDAMLASALFRSERLDIRAHLRCEIVGEPLPWKRGPKAAADQPIIVIENAATWHSYCRWNEERRLFSAVVYGCGNRFIDGVRYFKDVFDELSGPRKLLYFGDLDPQGLAIPQIASARAQKLGSPPIEPHTWSYRQLLILGSGKGQPWEGDLLPPKLCDWLGELAEPARLIIAAGQRLPQEHLGWEFLQKQPG